MLYPAHVDDREFHLRKIPLVRAGFISKRLSVGDADFPEIGGGTVIIETKKMAQFYAEMNNGQVVRQCRRLMEETDFGILMLEGPISVDALGNILGQPYTEDRVWDEILNCQETGIMLDRVVDTPRLVQRILHLAERYSREVHSAQNSDRHPSGNVALSVLSHIYGVGTDTGKKLVTGFRSLENIAVADVEQLRELDGIGPKTASRIRDFWEKDRR